MIVVAMLAAWECFASMPEAEMYLCSAVGQRQVHEKVVGQKSTHNTGIGDPLYRDTDMAPTTTNNLLDWVWIRRLGNKKDTNSIPVLLRAFELDAAKDLPFRDSALEGEVCIALAGMPSNAGRPHLFACASRIVKDVVTNTSVAYDADLGHGCKTALRLIADYRDTESLRFLKETGEKSAICSTLPIYASYLWLKIQMETAGATNTEQRVQWIYSNYERSGMSKMSNDLAWAYRNLMQDAAIRGESAVSTLIASATKAKGKEYEGVQWLNDVAERLKNGERMTSAASEGEPWWRPDWEGNLPTWAALNIDGYDESGTAIVKTNVLAGISSNDLVDYKWVRKIAASRDTNAIPLLVRAFNENMNLSLALHDAVLQSEVLKALNAMPKQVGGKYLSAIIERLSPPDVQDMPDALVVGVGLLAENPSEAVTAKLQEWVSKTNDVNYERLIPFAYPVLLKRQMKAEGVVKAEAVVEWLYKHAGKEGFGNLSQPTFDAITTIVSEMPGKGIESIQKLKARIVGERGKDSDAAKWLDRLQKSVE